MGQKEPEHTPGPWRLRKLRHEGVEIEDEQDSLLVAVTHRHAGTFDGGYEEMPCEANARLIAAAPDLLEALRQILAADMQGVLLPSRLSELAAAAVKKARGGK